LLKVNNIDFTKNWTWKAVAQYSKDFMKRNKGRNAYFFNSGFNFSSMIKNSEVPFIDYSNKKSNFNSDAFKQLLQLYKEIYPSADRQGRYFKDNLIDEREVLIYGTGMGEPLYFRMHYDDVISYSGSEMVVLPTPTISGTRKEYVTPNQCIAVNSRCKNKEAAFGFIKIAASCEIQQNYSQGKPNGIFALPVNSKAYKSDMLEYKSTGSLPGLIVDQMTKTQSSVEPCLIKDYKILDLVDELAKDYVEGRKTLEQVTKDIDNKVSVFLNE
jgi:ABC-type glycerol-3-phosphate transport system substrate-binding protein